MSDLADVGGNIAVRNRREIIVASRPTGTNLHQVELSVPGIHCGGCLRRIEVGLCKLANVQSARVNLSLKRATVMWCGASPPPLIETLQSMGFEAHIAEASTKVDRTRGELVRALAVAGFASANIMSFSVAVWAGAGPSVQQIFHWIAAVIAIPSVAYAGRPFFTSAWRSLRGGRLNMDVPISLGVLLSLGMSLYDTALGKQHVYFDAAVSLLFVLLVGRTLDHLMREKARSAAAALAGLIDHGAVIVRPDGTVAVLSVAEIKPGMIVRLAAGERAPVDGVILSGSSMMDMSLITGEATPQAVSPGARVSAGALNLSSSMDLSVSASAKDSFLAEMRRLMEAAEIGRAGYRRIADRAADLYAPVVHLTALAALVGWLAVGADLHQALSIAVAVLIITCPCALGLAVPMVQVVAAQRLFSLGILLKDGATLERLNDVDTVVFDKTGTLTQGKASLLNAAAIDPNLLSLAAAIAVHSRHPYAKALTTANGVVGPNLSFGLVSEHHGVGVEAILGDCVYRLGRAAWALGKHDDVSTGVAASGTVLTRDGQLLAEFVFEDSLREGAQETVETLKELGFKVFLLSGDQTAMTAEVARQTGITAFHAELNPGGKVAILDALRAAGCRTLMVGDGLNDAPALAAAHASMAPAAAADISRSAADLVFLRESLTAVPSALMLAKRSQRLVRQNFALAVGYNLFAVPLAVAGLVTPLIAAATMSLSSMTVVANAMRLNGLSGGIRVGKGLNAPRHQRFRIVNLRPIA